MLLKTTRSEGLPAGIWVLLILVMLTTALLCVCVGSVSIPVEETLTVIGKTLLRQGADSPIILSVRLPRVICVALSGAALSLSGVAMQGLLKNPLADGSTLGVSSGASLGAVVAIAFGISIPGLPFAGTTVMAILFAFLSLLLILTLAYKMDYTLSTSTIILIGVIFSMFVSSILSLIVTFAADKIKSITFWTMGSLAGSTYENALVLLGALVLFGGMIFFHAGELNVGRHQVNAFRVVQDTLTRLDWLIHQNTAHRVGQGKGQLVWLGMAQADGQAALRVSVDQQHLSSGLRQPDPQVGTGRCLANAAFLVGDGDNLCVHFAITSFLE